MTATTSGVRRLPPVRRPAAERVFAGFPLMVQFIVRRNWLRMLVWVVVLAGLVAVVIQSQHTAFPTQADRNQYAAIANTPAVAALTGLPYAAATLGGILVIKLWMTNTIALAFAALFLVTRNGRAEEEAGRTELLRSGVLGQHAYSLANWLVVAVFAAVTGLACGGAAIACGLPVDGSLVMGASFTGVALVFIGVAAVAGQLAQTSRGANAAASAVLGIAYLVRAGADLASTGETPSALRWASPIGWSQQMRAYGENLWWPLLVPIATAVVLCAVALRLEAARDVGAGLLPARGGPTQATRLMQSPVGLTLRLQRGPLIGWAIGIVVGALFYGTVATAMATVVAGDSPISKLFSAGGATVLDSLLGFFIMANALLVGAYVIQSTDTIRTEEANGSCEMQWSGALSRLTWAAARIAVPAVVSLAMLAASGLAIGWSYGASVTDAGQPWRFAGASLAYWPSILILIAVVVACAAWIPRASSTVTWAIYSVSVVLSLFGGLFSLPNWVINNTPFTAVPRLGSADSPLAPLAVLTILAIVIGACGLARLRGRDMTGA